MKNATTIVLLIFVVVTIGYLVIGDRGDGSVAPRDAAAPTMQSSPVGSKAVEIDEPTKAIELVAGDEPEETAGQVAETATDTAADAKSSYKIIAYYFHRTQRCHTCLTMEAYAAQALKDGLSDAFESGTLEWRTVNVEEPENEHFVMEYELYTSELVMVETEGGQTKRWKKLEQIWDLVGNELEFKTFVRNEALAYLEDAP